MRDPRFEPAQVEIVGGLHRGAAVDGARAPPAGGAGRRKPQTVVLDVTRIDKPQAPVHVEAPRPADATTLELTLPPLDAGGYTARLRVGGGGATRHDFACEAGGDEWADSRPDPQRLEALAERQGGTFVYAADAASLPLPKPTVVSAERHVTPLAPPWTWTLGAALSARRPLDRPPPERAIVMSPCRERERTVRANR